MHLLNCVSHMQSEIEQRPFWFRRKFEKRALLFYRVFRNLSFGNLPGFLWCEAIRIPAFFIFKKGAGSQLLIFSRSPVTKIRVNILPGKFNITSANIANKKKCSLLPELFRPRSKVNITSVSVQHFRCRRFGGWLCLHIREKQSNFRSQIPTCLSLNYLHSNSILT